MSDYRGNNGLQLINIPLLKQLTLINSLDMSPRERSHSKTPVDHILQSLDTHLNRELA